MPPRPGLASPGFCLSYQAVQTVAAGRFVVLLEDNELLEDDEPEAWPVNILYAGGLVPQKLRAFIDFAAPRLSAVLSEQSAHFRAAAPLSATRGFTTA